MLRKSFLEGAIAALALISGSEIAAGFGDVGHLTVCQIAAAKIAPATQAAIGRIIRSHRNRGDDAALSDAELGQRLARECVWPDQVKRQPAWAATGNYHFINLEDGQHWAIVEPSDASNAKLQLPTFATEGDMLQQLLAAKKSLANPEAPLEQKLCHLRFLGHIAGDSHQPLHVGRASDRGGNDQQLPWRGIKLYPVKSIRMRPVAGTDTIEADCIARGHESPSQAASCTSVEILHNIDTNLHTLWDDAFIDLMLVEAKLRPGPDGPYGVYERFAKLIMDDEAAGKIDSLGTGELESSRGDSFLHWVASSARYRDVAYDATTHFAAADTRDRPFGMSPALLQMQDELIALGRMARDDPANKAKLKSFADQLGALLEGEDNTGSDFSGGMLKALDPENPYFRPRSKLIQAQLLRAGYHLAGMLDRIFAPHTVPMTPDAEAHAQLAESQEQEIAARIAAAFPAEVERRKQVVAQLEAAQQRRELSKQEARDLRKFKEPAKAFVSVCDQLPAAPAK